MSRPILREALKELEARGLVDSRHGGGTFVADVVGQIFSKPLIELIGRHHKATQDYLEYRRELEGLTAELAATRATDFDRDILTRVISACAPHTRAATSPKNSKPISNCTMPSAKALIISSCFTPSGPVTGCYPRHLLPPQFVFDAPARATSFSRSTRRSMRRSWSAIRKPPRQPRRANIDFVATAAREAERSGEWVRIARLRLQQRDRAGS